MTSFRALLIIILPEYEENFILKVTASQETVIADFLLGYRETVECIYFNLTSLQLVSFR